MRSDFSSNNNKSFQSLIGVSAADYIFLLLLVCMFSGANGDPREKPFSIHPPCPGRINHNNMLNQQQQQHVCMYDHTYCSKSMNQPGKVANPACSQLNRENE